MNVFVQEQNAIKARLQSHAYFADVPIVTEEKGTITEEVAQSIASAGLAENAGGKVGIAVVLRTPGFENADPRTSGLSLVLQAKVSIYEQVTVNQDLTHGIGKPALDVLQAVIFLLHGWTTMRAVGRHAITGGDSEESEGGLVAYHVDVATAAAIGGMPS